MKKRSLWLIAAVVIAAVGIGFAFMIDKVSISASSVALAEQGWRANFSSEVHPDAIEKGFIYLTDAEEEPVDVEMILLENGKTLEIPRISIGEYILHVKKSAIKGNYLKSLPNNKVTFSVQEKITALSNEEELKAYFQQLLNLQKSNERYGVFGEGSDMATEESASSDSAGAGAAAESEHSSTNNQVEGVDEADIVKTDGSFIYTISESRVLITDARNPDDLKNGAEITLEPEMYPQQLFLSDDTLVVMGSEYSIMPREGEVNEDMAQHISMTSVYLYDISDPASPSFIRKVGTEGNLNGARLTEGILYYVTNVYPDMWMMEQQDDVELRPRTYDSNDGEELSTLEYDRISILPGTMEGSYSIVSAIDLANPAANEVSTEGFLGGSEQLYMTKESLYLTAAAYVPMDGQNTDDVSMDIWIPQLANTEIYKFALDNTDITFLASSEVKGTLLNQFSMDEYNGFFRIVTTEGFAWDEASPSKNHLFILDGGMEQVGSVEDLAKGERIYSARFMGDKAYMVTFKETDPLFVIDVSAPSSPQVLGELKIPGFSNYLHPLGEDHLIGFGSDTKLEAAKEGEARVVTGGMKISLFDVSDFENPVEKDVEIIGGQGTNSALQYDHKALFTHQEKNLFGFPVAVYRETSGDFIEFEGEGAMIYTITPDGIEQTANLMQEGSGQYEDWNTSVQRIIYIGDALYTVAHSEIKSYDMNTFKIMDTIEY